MTAGALARETGLTTASITGMIDRLADAGFVRRERDAEQVIRDHLARLSDRRAAPS